MRRAIALLLCLFLVAPSLPLPLGVTPWPALAAQGPTKCPNKRCGKGTQPAWKFCKFCGTRLAPPKKTVVVCQQSGLRPNPHCPSTVGREYAPGKEPAAVCSDHKSLVSVRVCQQSGLRPTTHCPRIVSRDFEAGKEPSGACAEHKALVTLRVCQQSGLRPNAHCPSTISRDYEAGKEPSAPCAEHKPEVPKASSILTVCADSRALPGDACLRRTTLEFEKGAEPNAVCTLHTTASPPGSLNLVRRAVAGETSRYRQRVGFDVHGTAYTASVIITDKVLEVKQNGDFLLESRMSDGIVEFGSEKVPFPESPPVRIRFSALGAIIAIESLESDKSTHARFMNLLTFRYPNKAVSIGEEWSLTYDIDHSTRAMAATATFKVVSLENVNGREAAKVAFDCRETTGTERASGSGFYWIDRQSGKMIKCEASFQKMPVPGAPTPLDMKLSMSLQD